MLLTVVLSTIQVIVRFCSVPPQFCGKTPWRWSGVSPSILPPTSTRGLADRRLFRVPLCRKGTIHLQTHTPSPGFEPRPIGSVVNLTNHYTKVTNRPPLGKTVLPRKVSSISTF
ncbi:hypothetical protein TNCV_2298621 [Trichonephila clavipes]|nr:hypothetical protein TNCV_2298621 [Trichonephila clavipes]